MTGQSTSRRFFRSPSFIAALIGFVSASFPVQLPDALTDFFILCEKGIDIIAIRALPLLLLGFGYPLSTLKRTRFCPGHPRRPDQNDRRTHCSLHSCIPLSYDADPSHDKGVRHASVPRHANDGGGDHPRQLHAGSAFMLSDEQMARFLCQRNFVDARCRVGGRHADDSAVLYLINKLIFAA